jgi:hypothetical protein
LKQERAAKVHESERALKLMQERDRLRQSRQRLVKLIRATPTTMLKQMLDRLAEVE